MRILSNYNYNYRKLKDVIIDSDLIGVGCSTAYRTTLFCSMSLVEQRGLCLRGYNCLWLLEKDSSLEPQTGEPSGSTRTPIKHQTC